MAKNTPLTTPGTSPASDCAIQLGSVHLTLTPLNGKLFARHASLAKPVEIDSKQIERMVLRQLREQVR